MARVYNLGNPNQNVAIKEIKELLETKTDETDFQVLKKQLLQLIASGELGEEGSVETEVHDGRVGYDGVIYDSIGEAIRALGDDLDAMNSKVSETLDSSLPDGILISDGFIYLTSKGEIVSDGVEIPTTIGTGGTAGSATVKLKNELSSATLSVTKGSSVTLQYFFSSVEDDVSTGNGTAQYFVNSVLKASETIPQGSHSFNIGDYLTEGTNTVRVKVIDSYGNYKTISYTVIVLDLSLVSSFDDSIVYTSTNVTFKYTPYGSIDKTVYFVLDGQPYSSVAISSSGKQTTQIITGLTHGSHTLEVYATAQLYGETIHSNTLKYDIAYAQDGHTEPIIAATCNVTDTVQGNLISIPYLVYNPSSLTSDVLLQIYYKVLDDDGVYVDTLFSSTDVEVGRSQNTWSVKNYPTGEVRFVIKYGTYTKEFTVQVDELSIEVDPVTNDLELCLQAAGRTNSENSASRSNWEFESEDGTVVTTKFDKVNWNTTGWVIDDDGDTSLTLSGDSTAEIQFKPFSSDLRTYGKTIEFEFMVHDINDRDSVVISCEYGGIGIIFTGDTAKMSSEQTTVSCKYRDKKKVRVSFVVESTSENRVFAVYLNGILSQAKQYPTNDNFQQAVPANITIGSKTAGISVYTIRIYNTALSSAEMRENYIADTSDPGKKVTLYNDNNIYDPDTKDIVYDSVIQRIPTMTIIGDLPQSKGDKKTVSIEFVHPDYPDLSFSAKPNVTIDVQGTSSQYYIRKNYKLKFKEAFQHALDQLAAKVFCVKADYAESTSVNNTQNANIIHTLYKELTPAQEVEPLCRTCIYGYPITIFHQENENSAREFIGKYNFNFDKGAENVYGFTSDFPDVECWEVCNNTSQKCLMHDDDLRIVYDESGKETYNPTDDYEGRYPDGNEDFTNLQRMISFVASTWQDGVPHEYSGSFDALKKDTSVDTSVMYMIMDSSDAGHYLHYVKCITGTESSGSSSVITYTWQDMGLYPKMEEAETYTETSYEYDSKNGWHYVTGATVTYEYDTDKRRLAKFKEGFLDYFDMHYCLVYYVYTFVMLMIDQRTKNLMWTSWDKTHWQPWFYDNDTCMGINNEGLLVFDYWYEDTDLFEGGTVFNGQDHAFWVNFRMCFANEIKEMYQSMRGDGRLSYSKMIDYFNTNGSDKWCISIYNEDSEYKYLSLLRNGNDSTYLYMIMGSGVDWREYYLSNRLNYCDSKWYATDYANDYATLRIYTPTEYGGVVPNADITLTPYSSMYIGVRYKANGTLLQERATEGVPVTIKAPTNEVFSDTETQIYGASELASLGDLSPLYCGTINVANCTKLVELIIGNGADGYHNDNLKNLSIGNNTLLRKIDIRNCPNLTDPLSLYNSQDKTGCLNVEEIYATGSSITGLELPPSGYLKIVHLPGTLTNLTIRNQQYIQEFTMDGYSALTTLWIEDSVNIPIDDILANASKLNRVRLTGVDWEAATADNLKRLSNMQGIDENGANTDTAVITGSCHIVKINGEDLSSLRSKFPYLTITYDTMIYTVTFKNWDGTVLEIQEVESGQNGVDPTKRSTNPLAEPTKEADEQYWYKFSGWTGGSYNQVKSNQVLVASFTNTLQEYIVTFKVNDVVTQTSTRVQYGTSCAYTKDEPTKSADVGYYMWTGWADEEGNMYANEYITGDTVCIAQFDHVCVPGWEDGGTISRITNFQECTWGQILAVCEAQEKGILTDNAGLICDVSRWWNAGDEKAFTLTTGEDLVAQIMDFNRDILTQEEGYTGETKYAAISLCFKDGMAKTRQMNSGTYPLYDYKLDNTQADKSVYSVTATYNGKMTLEFTGHSYIQAISIKNSQGVAQTIWYFDEKTSKDGVSDVHNFSQSLDHEASVITFYNLQIDATNGIVKRYTDSSNSWNNFTEVTEGVTMTIPVEEGDIVTVEAFDRCRNTGGWEKAELRKWVNNELYNQMPRGLKQCIKPVQKKSSVGFRSTEISEVSDYMWLLANCELVNRKETEVPYYQESSGTKNASGGTNYALFTNNQSRKKWLANGKNAGDRSGNSDMWWWERSPSVGNVYYFLIVGTDGYPSYGYWADYNGGGVVAGFSI
jgi:hypothetical protein